MSSPGQQLCRWELHHVFRCHEPGAARITSSEASPPKRAGHPKCQWIGWSGDEHFARKLWLVATKYKAFLTSFPSTNSGKNLNMWVQHPQSHRMRFISPSTGLTHRVKASAEEPASAHYVRHLIDFFTGRTLKWRKWMKQHIPIIFVVKQSITWLDFCLPFFL